MMRAFRFFSFFVLLQRERFFFFHRVLFQFFLRSSITNTKQDTSGEFCMRCRFFSSYWSVLVVLFQALLSKNCQLASEKVGGKRLGKKKTRLSLFSLFSFLKVPLFSYLLAAAAAAASTSTLSTVPTATGAEGRAEASAAASSPAESLPPAARSLRLELVAVADAPAAEEPAAPPPRPLAREPNELDRRVHSCLTLELEPPSAAGCPGVADHCPADHALESERPRPPPMPPPPPIPPPLPLPLRLLRPLLDPPSSGATRPPAPAPALAAGVTRIETATSLGLSSPPLGLLALSPLAGAMMPTPAFVGSRAQRSNWTTPSTQPKALGAQTNGRAIASPYAVHSAEFPVETTDSGQLAKIVALQRVRSTCASDESGDEKKAMRMRLAAAPHISSCCAAVIEGRNAWTPPQAMISADEAKAVTAMTLTALWDSASVLPESAASETAETV